MQAMILAAGMGKRLGELTGGNTKCMVKVNGVTLIERVLRQLDTLGLSCVVMVVGYQKQGLIDYIATLDIKTPIEYVSNDIYDKTNNIYSLYLAKDYLMEEDTLLLESDLIFEDGILRELVDNPYPNLALVAKYESWMDGTVVTLDDDDAISSFIPGKEFDYTMIDAYFKTVNIYKFSRRFALEKYVPFLEAYMSSSGVNEYYEQVLRVIVQLGDPTFKAMRLIDRDWYEIDDVQDLDVAESIFAGPEERFDKLQSRYGGFWRYPRLKDFCYLVNPFFPPKRLLDELQADFSRLVCDYPSGMRVNSLLAAKYFGVHEDCICVGNGAAELIKSLIDGIEGNVGVIYPTFEEYPNRVAADRLVPYLAAEPDFRYTAGELIEYFSGRDLELLVLVNPDNPTGHCMPREQIEDLIAWGGKEGVDILVDESFADFASEGAAPTFFDQAYLEAHPNLLMMKSISKSFGVPGLRLGVFATADTVRIAAMKKDVSIWNINSFGECYLQIAGKYKGDYSKALERFREVRDEYASGLTSIPFLRVLPSEANYICCEVLPPHTSRSLAVSLLDSSDILIKDLASKKGFNERDYIRLAVKKPEDNEALLGALRALI
ncbi:MAG: aminotransferase class I/II-fold pyridoxal phosphate-dependent enzyme [Actinobacteria bacterium]|nr:aminotransferase class I/II-fold pyridoxal phosphate-dependent enzyme [Actinomycetota bacterium]